MIHLRLSDADRERLGCPEWLDIDPYSVTAREAAALQRGFDLAGERVIYAHPGEWRAALLGEVVVDERGAPVMQPVESDDGPKIVETRRANFGAFMVLVWLALRRVDIAVPFSELDFNVDQLAYRGDPAEEPEPDADPEASPGKDAEPPTSPERSEQSTTSTP